MKNIFTVNAALRLLASLTVALTLVSGSMAQPKTLASVIAETIDFKNAPINQGNAYRVVDLDFSIKEGAVLIRNISPSTLLVKQKKHNLRTVLYLTMTPAPYIRGGVNSQISGSPNFTTTHPDFTFTVSSNSTLVSNPDLVDQLTLSYKTSGGTTNVGLSNAVTVSEGSTDAAFVNDQRVVKRYIITGTVDGKVIKVEIRHRLLIFG